MSQSRLPSSRILHLGKYYPPVQGGTERITEDLHRLALADAGASVVACFDGGDPSGASDDGRGVLRFRTELTVRSAPIALSMLPWAIRHRRSFDLVHVHMPNPWGLIVLALLGSGPRVVLHWHMDVERQRLLRHILAPLHRWALRRCRLVLATSEAYAAASPGLRRRKDRVRVIPLGIEDPTTLPPTEPDRAWVRGLVSGRRFVLALGRLVWYKGFDRLVQAAHRLPEDVAVVVAGTGPLSGSLERLVREQGLADRVLLPGGLEDGRVRALFEACALFVLPSVSRVEAFGLVQLEAMAWSKPVVSTRIEGSGVPWVNRHGETGTVVPPDDPEALGAAITSLLADPGRADALGAAGRRRFDEGFRKERMLAGIRAAWEEALA